MGRLSSWKEISFFLQGINPRKRVSKQRHEELGPAALVDDDPCLDDDVMMMG